MAKQINTLNKLAKLATRARIGHVAGTVLTLGLPGPTAARISVKTLLRFPRLRHIVASKLGVKLGRSINLEWN